MTQKIAICGPSHKFVGLHLRNEGTYRQSDKNLISSNVSSTSHSIVNFGRLAVEIGSVVWGTPANFNRFRILASLLQRHRSPEVNQTLNDVRPSPALVHDIYIFGALAPDGILPGAKFTLRASLTFSYNGSVTARHSSSGRRPNFAAYYKE